MRVTPIEHLADGEIPTLTAVFNPVRDGATKTEPTSGVRVRGWRASKTAFVGVFGASE